jgi:DNA gyrase/topoisomerase IV subunit B
MFIPDPEIFGDLQFDFKRIVERVRTKAYLIPGVEFEVLNLETLEQEKFLFNGGLSDFLADTVEEQKLDLTTEFPMVAETDNEVGKIQVALTWTYGVDEQVFSFANGIPTEGGSHVDGLRQGVVRAVKEYWETSGAPKRTKPTPEDIR